MLAAQDIPHLPHLGGGRKGLFLLLRYVFIIAASYLLIFQPNASGFEPAHALMIAAALASNVALSWASPALLFSWYLEAPILVADTLWVAWALHSTAQGGQEFFLLYFFVLFVAAVSERLWIVVLGTVIISIANIFFTPEAVWTTPHLLRIVFFFSVALFYGNSLTQIQRERQRAQRGFAMVKELGDKVAERNEELRWLYEEALVANRLKSELVANVSHELRTPLHQIIGYNDLLREGEFGPVTTPQREAGAALNKSAHALLRLIDAMLDVRRLDAGTAPVDIQEIAVADLTREIDPEIRQAHVNQRVALEWAIPPGLPTLQSDPTKLRMILRNLVLNALKFTDAGSVRISVARCEEGLEFAVADTGIGIPAIARKVIFEPFVQADGSLTRAYGGVGLGLFIVQRLVEALGASIDLDSELGRGSVFRVRVPLRYVPVHTATAEPPEDVRSQPAGDTPEEEMRPTRMQVVGDRVANGLRAAGQ